MFSRLDAFAEVAIAVALEVARLREHSEARAVHLLAALVLDDDVAASLARTGVDAKAVKVAADEVLGAFPPPASYRGAGTAGVSRAALEAIVARATAALGVRFWKRVSPVDLFEAIAGEPDVVAILERPPRSEPTAGEASATFALDLRSVSAGTVDDVRERLEKRLHLGSAEVLHAVRVAWLGRRVRLGAFSNAAIIAALGPLRATLAGQGADPAFAATLVARPSRPPEMSRAVDRAVAMARAAKHTTLTVEHVARVLIDDAEAGAAVESAGGDLARAKQRLDEVLAQEPDDPTQTPAMNRELAAFLRTLDRRISTLGSTPFTSQAEMIAAIPDTSIAARLLEDVGAPMVELRSVVAHGQRWKVPDPTDSELPEEVVFHNDAFTTFEAVIEILRRTFDYDEMSAVRLMSEVHEEGCAGAGSFPASEARRLAAHAMSDARARRMPLLVTCEPEEER